MKRFFTVSLTLFAMAVLWAPLAEAQITDVTIREINAIPQDSIDALNAAAETLNDPRIENAIFNDLVGDTVRIGAIVMSDPTLSGLSSPDGSGLPSRVHFFVRDTAAVSQGVEGMGTQIVDGSWQENGVLGLLIGDVVEMVGTVSPFDEVMQIAPVSITVIGTVGSFGYPASIMDPVVISTADVHRIVTGGIQANWSNLANLRGQYVRFENALVQRRDISSDRPNWTFSTDGGATQLYIRDISLAYRNDRDGAYDDSQFRVFFDDFTPPPPGSGINLQGFLAFDDFDPFGIGAPDDGLIAIAPMEREDLEVTVTPPIITNVTRPTTVVGAETVSVSADVTADPARTLSSVGLNYYTSAAPDTVTVAAVVAANDTTYSADIPAQPDGDFVTYWFEATDDQDASTVSPDEVYRVLTGGIDSISDIQLTVDGGEGPSPFQGLTTAMNITGSINSRPDSSGWYIVQDDVTGAPWSGIVIEATDAVTALGLGTGDLVNITAGTVVEIRGGFRFDRSGDVTAIAEPTVALVTPGVTGQVYKTVTTDVLQDEAVAEGHESMLLRFENVTLTTNQADDPSDFGEWAVSSDGTADNQVRVDDSSPLISSSYNDDLVPGTVYSFHKGVWSNTFGNFKLLPEDLSDIGDITNVAIESEEIPDGFALEQNYPNPFNPSTTIRFDVAQTSHISVEVFDVVGRRVAQLVDRELAAGTHSVTFDARDMASGMYVYRLTAGSEVINKTMMLLK